MNSPPNLERVVGSVIFGIMLAVLSFIVVMGFLSWLALRSGFLALHLFEFPDSPDPHEQFVFFGSLIVSLIVSCCVLVVAIWHGLRTGKGQFEGRLLR
jgi:uncharacterized membrane protein